MYAFKKILGYSCSTMHNKMKWLYVYIYPLPGGAPSPLYLTLLMLLSHFSLIWLCATPQTAAHQAPPPLGFSRQEYWSGLPFPSPMYENEKWKWSHSVVSNSSRPHGLQPTRLLHPWIFQARVLEWGAIAFSDLTPLGHHSAPGWAPCTMQQLPLAICVTHGSDTRQSQSPNSSHPPPMSTRPFSVCISIPTLQIGSSVTFVF